MIQPNLESYKSQGRRGSLPARLRRLIRSAHRDIGYLCVGLTFVYALSGLAVNHIADWDPNFRNVDESFALPTELRGLEFSPGSPLNAAAGQRVVNTLRIDGTILDVYAVDSTQLDITLESGELHLDLQAERIDFSAQKERFFLRAANFLHLNRGKQAWTYVADSYAVLLLVLATTGLFMIPGRKGLLGRGAILAGIGATIPVAYVLLSPP